VPEGTLCHKLDGGSQPWVVGDISFIKDKQSLLYFDADHYGIRVPPEELQDIYPVGLSRAAFATGLAALEKRVKEKIDTALQRGANEVDHRSGTIAFLRGANSNVVLSNLIEIAYAETALLSVQRKRVFIECEKASVDLLTSLGAMTEKYDDERKGLFVSATDYVMKEIAEFPADFTVTLQLQRDPQFTKINDGMNLVVDGIGEDGNFAGDGENAPFVIFDVEQQQNIAGPYDSRVQAESAMALVLSGATPVLNKAELSRILATLDNRDDCASPSM
jgi:hypothetical protein